MTKKTMLRSIVMCGIVALVNIQIMQPLKSVQGAQSQGVSVDFSVADTEIIPDKYNTGCKGELKTVEMDTDNGMNLDGVLFISGSNNTRFVLDFAYRNKDISGTVYIENYDFSSYPLWSYNEDKVDRQIKVVFNNCKFSGVAVGKTEENLSFEFNNCSINNFSGSNSTFNRCQFGKSYSDGVVPFCNVQVNDCFFMDMGSMMASDKEIHTDGTQIYGIAGTDVQNVSYDNCRFSIPALRPEGSTAYINACIMLQLEYSNAKNLSFTDCIVNGGGYSIYARGKSDGFTFENVSFDGIRFGDARKYGVFYPDVNTSIQIRDVAPTDSLYIGSVWKEDGETHFSVTNDTNRERSLLIYTDKGLYTYTIPACLSGSELTGDVTYEDLPFDLDIVISQDCQYAVCFDNTIGGCGKQIRFLNWSAADVYLTEEIWNEMYLGKNELLAEGKCGNNVSFTLTKDGVLTLSGSGSTYNYHSAKFPEWIDYIDYIKEIRVEEGIESLGSMIFRNCVSVKMVTLPDSLISIGQYAFGGCVSLAEFTLPAGITTLGKSVFSGTVLQKIYYAGDNWNMIEIGTGNENLLERIVLEQPQNGLVFHEEWGVWAYFESGEWISDKYDFVDYNGGRFLVANGVVADISGLVLFGDTWYYLANGQLINNYVGLTEYDGEWFYVENGILANNYNGIQEYDGAKFLVAEGRILFEYSGLYQALDGTWYFVANGQVQTQHTGLALYDGAWFYIVEGLLAVDYSGEVVYDGAIFNVAGGMLINNI